MPDLVHSFTNWIDHNRDRVLGIVIAAAVLTVPACGWLEGKALDPTTGEQATADVIHANATAKLDLLDAQISTLTSQRESLVARANESLEDANTQTADNYAFANDVLTSPLVAPWLAATGVGGLALGFFERRNSRRKDRVIRSLKDGGQA